MNDPIQDIGPVVHSLCQGPPDEQKAALEQYFTEDAAFIHPFCRVDSFPGSRNRLIAIFRWYKIMSPQIELEIQSVAYDEIKQILYVTIRQVFAIWFLFGLHNADVILTTKLQLVKKSGRYYIQSQNDLYQTDQFIKFCTVPRGIGAYFILLWQWLATINCIILAHVFSPITRAEQWYADQGKEKLREAREKNVSQLAGEAKQRLLSGAQEVRTRANDTLKTKVNGANGNQKV